MSATPPIISVMLEPHSPEDELALQVAIRALAANDSSFAARSDWGSGEIALAGPSGPSLSSIVGDLSAKSNFTASRFDAVYRETVTTRTEIDHTYTRPLPVGEFARVILLFEPGEPGSGLWFETRLDHVSVQDEFVLGVRRGVEMVARDSSFPVIDMKVTLLGAKYHDVDSSEHAFAIAAQQAFERLRDEGLVILEEPIMDLSARIPGGRREAVLADLRGRRAELQFVTIGIGEIEVAILATAPLASMIDFGEALDALTNGEGRFDLTFKTYRPIDQQPDPGLFPPAAAMRA